MDVSRPRVIRVTTDPYHLWNFMDGQARYLRDSGYDIQVVSAPGPLLEKFAAREQVPVHEVPMKREIDVASDIRSLTQLCRLFSQLRPDIVHGATPKAGLLTMLAGEWARVPIKIYHVAGLRWWTLRGLKRRIVMNSERTACGLSDLVLSVSPSVRQALVDHKLTTPDRIRVLAEGHENGIDVDNAFNPSLVGPAMRLRTREAFGAPRDAVIAGYFGRLVHDKGIEELTKAWLRLRDEIPRLHLLIVGENDDTDPVARETRCLLESDSRVHLAGWIEDVAPFYAAVDYCVLPSYREGFPTIPLEAGAMQRPTITTDAIGCVDAVRDGITGVRIPVGNADALTEAMRAYSLNTQLRETHGHAAREYVCAHYRREIVWEALRAEYQRLLEEKRLSPADAV
jgi:glycosyltransferase involved in cell wall biosynthesis